MLTTSNGTTFYILVEPGEHGLLPETPDGIKSMKTCMTFLTDTQGTVRQSLLSTNSRPWHYHALLAEPFIACLILAYLSKTLHESSQIIVKHVLGYCFKPRPNSLMNTN